jgi:hypothetical protein
LGLFDRPAEKGAVDILKSAPAIPGLTEQLQQLSEEDWQYALTNLRSANLLAREAPQKPDTLDCHPLVREHFGQKLREQNPDGWKEAHEIAELGSMKLHLVDYLLETARLCKTEGKGQEAEAHRLKAKKLIEKTGYARRKEEAGKPGS